MTSKAVALPEAKTKRTSATAQGNLPSRECTDQFMHQPHGWHSAVLNKEAWCKGTGKPTAFSSTGTVKTDYTKPDENGNPWRKNFQIPISVSEARKIAKHMHRNDTDKIGNPYGEHLEAVRMGVEVLGGNAEEQIAALFHDAVEDGHCTMDMLRKIGLTDHTIVMIEAVTKRSSEEQSKYRDRIIAAGPGAMRVKLADLLHNTRHDRMEKVKQIKGEYTRDRLLKKYRPFIAALMLELNIIVDEDEQKKLATKPQGTAGGSYTYSGSSTGTKSQNYAVDNLFPGDWMVGAPAPILFKIGKDEKANKGKGLVWYLLCNGQEWSEDIRWNINAKQTRTRAVYTKHAWIKDASIKFAGATEDQIADYIDMLDLSEIKPTWENYSLSIDPEFQNQVDAQEETYAAYAKSQETDDEIGSYDSEGFWWDSGIH